MTLGARFTGSLRTLSPADRGAILERGRGDVDPVVEARVRGILEQVRKGGDDALLALTRELDRAELSSLEVPRAALEAALSRLDRGLCRALERAARNIERVHRAFLPSPVEVESEPGVWVARRADPLAAVGVYAPGGRAAYPSSVLMGVVPARAAGVGDVVVCSPAGPSGAPSDVVLAAAAIGGATRVFALGGAQAIAALAFGTQTVPRVDRIVGPGNAYVAEAKRQVAGVVGIDSPAGPSEILILADETADPAHLARELCAQAEHDPEASCVALLSSEELARAVADALAKSAPVRLDIVSASLSSRGAVLSYDDLEGALAFANEYAAEHLLLAVRDPSALLPRLRNAGTVFFGEGASVAFGDYMTGANHVLPTATAARSFSGLSSLDFVRWTTTQRIGRGAASNMADDVALLASSEGLPAHAAAAAAFGGTAPGGEERAGPAARPSYAKMALYTSGRRPCAVDLSDNTNQRGAPPSALAVLGRAESESLARYPSHYADGLKRALAARLSIGADSIVTGCGSDDVLDSAIRAFAGPGDALAYSVPTFAMLPFFCHMNALEPRPVPLLGGERAHDIDADALLATGARVIYVCSPNNPTGTRASRAAIDRVVKDAPGLVILDEAYVEYSGESLVREASERGKLLVVRTLSKAWGLAGARIGFAVGAPALVSEVEKSRGPYKITRLAEEMAEAVVDHDHAWVEEGVREVLSARARFEAWLEGRGLAFVPSAANFVLVSVPDAAARATRLRALGVAVRPFPGLEGLGDALRISVGPWPLMERILPALAEVLT